MALSTAERYLTGLAKFGVRPSLERMRLALRRSGRPDRNYKTVLITGTNGKGTCAKALAEILCAHKLRVGLYTSPHLFSYRERFEICGRKISAADFERETRTQRDFLSAFRIRLTEFEFLTLLACRHFARRRVEWAVMEIGMGGRWDAVNAVDPCLSVITSVGVDHTEFLGQTPEEIAFDKAHVSRKNRNLLVGPVGREVGAVIGKVASRLGARPVFLPAPVRCSAGFFFFGRPWKCRQPPSLFGSNLALAIFAAQKILKSDFCVDRAQQGIFSSSLPCRFHSIRFHGRQVLLDVAHNEQALRALFAAVRLHFPPAPLRVLLGMQRHKKGEGAIVRFLRPGDEVWPIRLAHPRSKSAAGWKPFIALARRQAIKVCPPVSMRYAMSRLLRRRAAGGGAADSMGVVTGSFHTVREALAAA